MRVTTRLILVFGILTLLCVGWVVYFNYTGRRHVEFVLNININGKNTIFDRILKLEGAPFESFVYDISSRDDLCAFVNKPDIARGDQYLKSILHTSGINIIWIYTKDFDCVYTAAVGIDSAVPELPVPNNKLRELLSQRYFYHFFAQTSTGILELRCAPIQPSHDVDRVTPPQGFLFAGKIWNEAYLEMLSNLTESTLLVKPISGNISVREPSYDFDKGTISFSRILQDWDKTPLYELIVRSEAPVIKEIGNTGKNHVMLFLGFSIIIVSILALTLLYWVQLPLRRLIQTLSTSDVEKLKGLERQGTEYGRLAQLIKDFFRQQHELAQQIEEKTRAHNSLIAAHSQIQAREEELQATNEELIAQQQMLHSINTELRAANQQLRASQQDLIRTNQLIENTFNTALDGFAIINRSGRIIKANSTLASMFDIKPDEMIGMHVTRFVPRDMRHIQRQFVLLLERQGKVQHFDVSLQQKEKVVHVEMRGSYLRDESGNITGVLLCLRDITEQKRMQAQLQQVQKMEAIGTLAGGIAHDFNNILAGIMGYAELTRERLEPQNQLRKNLDKILTSCERARDLVRQILTFSRRTEEERIPVRMNDILTETFTLLRASIPATINIKSDVPQEPVIVNANPTHMHQFLMNLAANAAQAMSEHGGVLEISLNLREIGSDYKPENFTINPGVYACLRVSDTGIGIPPEYLSRIFDPFFTTKEVGKGTGMGLAVVYGIVKSHSGDIRVQSVPGRGTTFEILLPCVLTQPAPAADDIQAEIKKGSERILFIDDEKILVDLWKQMLESQGYQVSAFSDWRAALEHFQKNPQQFDLVITDQTMPGITGDRLSQLLLELRPNLPIILCTGYSERVSDEMIEQIGIKALLTKPITAPEITKTIREVMAETLHAKSSVQ